MINVIVELSKYVILTLMVIYTFHCFYMVKQLFLYSETFCTSYRI